MQQIGDNKMFDDGAHAAVVIPFPARNAVSQRMRGTKAPGNARAAPEQKHWRPVREVVLGLMILAATMMLMEAARQLFSGG